MKSTAVGRFHRVLRFWPELAILVQVMKQDKKNHPPPKKEKTKYS